MKKKSVVLELADAAEKQQPREQPQKPQRQQPPPAARRPLARPPEQPAQPQAQPLAVPRRSAAEWSVEERRAVVATICEQLGEGVPLSTICKSEGMPSPHTVGQWCRENEDLGREVAWARDVWCEVVAEDALRIADQPSTVMQSKQENGDTAREEVDRKLQVETRLKLLAKWSPRRYGELAAAASANTPSATGAPTINVGVQFVLTEERRAELIAKKRAAVERRLAAEGKA
jgi:hypothetical protein